MKDHALFDAFGEISEAYIEEANHRMPKKRPPLWIRLGAAAAAIAIILFAVFSHLSCRKDNFTITTEHYTLSCTNGKYYISIHDRSKTYYDPSGPSDLLVYRAQLSTYFHSVKEMRNDILSGTLTNEELQSILEAGHDGTGKLRIPDLSCLYEPTYPACLNGYMVVWSGDSYDFAFLTGMEQTLDEDSENNAIKFYTASKYAKMNLCSRASYRTNINRLKHFNRQSDYVITNKVRHPIKNATEYFVTDSSGNEKRIVISKRITAKKTIYVQEIYGDPNESVPTEINFYGKENKGYFSGTIRSANSFMEDYSVDQIYEFGLNVNKG